MYWKKILKYGIKLSNSFKNNQISNSLNYLLHLKYHIGHIGNVGMGLRYNYKLKGGSRENEKIKVNKIFGELVNIIKKNPKYNLSGLDEQIKQTDNLIQTHNTKIKKMSNNLVDKKEISTKLSNDILEISEKIKEYKIDIDIFVDKLHKLFNIIYGEETSNTIINIIKKNIK